MTWYEIVIIIGAAGIVLGVVLSRILRKEQGKTGCGCGCAGCAGCSACNARANGETSQQHTQQSP